MKSTIPQERIDWLAYDHWTGTDKAFAQSIGMDPNNFAQYKQRRRRQHPTIVDIPVDTIDLTSGIPGVAPVSHPEYTAVAPVSPLVTPHGIPDIARQSTVDALTSRVEVLEAFIATFQQRGIPVSPNGTPHLTDGIPVSEAVQCWEDPEDAKTERYIYGLQDPESGEVRYVGQCRDLWHRMAAHLLDSQRTAPRSIWLESLRARDRFPVFLVLEKTTGEQAHIRETWWIAHYAEHTTDLLNRAIPRAYGAIPVAPTTKHSFVIAIDMLDALQRYAAAHHAEIRAVLDLALRTFFAGPEGHADA